MSPPQASLDQIYGIYKTLKKSQHQQLKSLSRSSIDELTFFDPLLDSINTREALSKEELSILQSELKFRFEEELSDSCLFLWLQPLRSSY